MFRREVKAELTVSPNRVSVPYNPRTGQTDAPSRYSGGNNGDMAAGQPWAKGKGALAAALVQPQPLNPPFVKTNNGYRNDDSRDYWLFRGGVYSTDRGSCSSADLLDLSSQLAKGHAEAAQRFRPETRFQPSMQAAFVSGVAGARGRAASMSWTMSEDAIKAQEEQPLPIHPEFSRTSHGQDKDDGKDYWLFRGFVYSTQRGTYSSEDVKALALAQESKAKARLARAHALMAQVDVVERGGRQPIPDDVKMFVWQRDGGKCVRCGSTRNLEFDHIIPVSMGGANTSRNLQLLCEGCNRAKSGSLV